jgi:hypothetical protein
MEMEQQSNVFWLKGSWDELGVRLLASIGKDDSYNDGDGGYCCCCCLSWWFLREISWRFQVNSSVILLLMISPHSRMPHK